MICLLYSPDATLVFNPMGTAPRHYVPGRDPYWTQAWNIFVLIDPVLNNPIALWNTNHGGQVYFFERRYLKRDPKKGSPLFEFSHDPFAQPFAPNEGTL